MSSAHVTLQKHRTLTERYSMIWKEAGGISGDAVPPGQGALQVNTKVFIIKICLLTKFLHSTLFLALLGAIFLFQWLNKLPLKMALSKINLTRYSHIEKIGL